MNLEECSLAFNEDLEWDQYEPNLSILVNSHYENRESSYIDMPEEVVSVSGRMTISF